MKAMLFALLLLTALPAAAAPDPADAGPFRIGQLWNRGDGCPMPGTVDARISPDGEMLIVTFERFAAEATFADVARAQCNVAVPIVVPDGWRVSVDRVGYAGRVRLVTGSSAQLRREVFLGPGRGARFEPRVFNATTSYQFDDAIEGGLASECGKSSAVRLNLTLTARRPPGSSSRAVIHLDSFFPLPGLVVHLTWSPC